MMTDISKPVVTRGARGAAFAEFWHYFSMNRGAVLGLIVFGLLVVVAIFAPVIAPHSPDQQYRDAILTPPIWDAMGDPRFLLGTDPVGRDMLSRLIHGARYSLFIGLFVVVGALVVGVVLGVLAGYFGGWVDALIMRVMDIILSFPSLLLALVLVAILGPGLFNAMVAIALVLQPHFALSASQTARTPTSFLLAHPESDTSRPRTLKAHIVTTALHRESQTSATSSGRRRWRVSRCGASMRVFRSYEGRCHRRYLVLQ